MPTAFVRSASALDTSVPRRAAVDEHRNAFADFGDDLRQRFDRRASRFRRPAAAIRFGDAEITRERPYARVQRGMSIKMQAPSVFKELPVRQNIHVALQQQRIHKTS